MAWLAWGPGSLAQAPSDAELPSPPVPVVRSPEVPAAQEVALAGAGRDHPVEAAREPVRWSLPSGVIDPAIAKVTDGRLVQDLSDGVQIEFTLEPRLQAVAKEALARYQVGHGVMVALDPTTGELLAYAEHAEGKPETRHLPVQANGPAASIFKLVTTTALLESGLEPTSTICTRGGLRKLTLNHLRADPKRDTRCETLAEAFGNSTNAAFARWSDERLDASKLREVGSRFLFGRRIPFVYGVSVSAPIIPSGSRLGFARSAAGFSRTSLSPLHAALLVSAVANGGKMMAPRMVRRATRGQEVLYEAETAELTRVMQPDTAASLTEIMVATTTTGTAKKFFIKNGRERIPGVAIAAKTGHLSGGEGLAGHYSWFVAFAPAEEPEVAVAAMIVNGEVWTTKGAVVARRFLTAYFNDRERAAQ